MIVDYLRCRLAQFKLGIYALDLGCLFLEACGQRFDLLLLPRDGSSKALFHSTPDSDPHELERGVIG